MSGWDMVEILRNGPPRPWYGQRAGKGLTIHSTVPTLDSLHPPPRMLEMHAWERTTMWVTRGATGSEEGEHIGSDELVISGLEMIGTPKSDMHKNCF